MALLSTALISEAFPMILRTSQKLAARLKLRALCETPIDPNPFADWSAHLFTADRTPYVILTNSASLYSVLMTAIGVTTKERFVASAANSLREYMTADGFESEYRQFVSCSVDSVQFAAALNRSVTGSMNDLIRGAKLWLSQHDLPLKEITVKLNETPLSYLDYRTPREALRAMGSG